MKPSQIIFASTTLAASLAASTAFAAIGHPASSKLPKEMVQGQVRYVSGGIGHEEALAFERAARSYPLTLEFAKAAKPRNEFMADVKVVIRDSNGNTVLDTVSGGPFLLAKLPAGRYDINATWNGKSIDRHAYVAEGKPIHLGLLWPST